MTPDNNSPKISVIYDYKKESSENHPGTVWVRVYMSRTQRKYISTGVRVLPTEWDSELMVIRRRDAAQLNKMIREQVESCRAKIQNAIQDRIELPTTQQMKVDRRDASFLDYMEKKIIQAPIQDATRRHHMITLGLLYEWGKMRRFDQVNRRNILDFIQWLSTRVTTKKVGSQLTPSVIQQTTVFDHWKRLHRYIRLAIEDLHLPASTLIGIHVPRGEHKEREHLTDEELRLWIETPLPLPYLEDARDRFIVQMGTGLSYRDMMEADWSKHERIGKQMVLTGHRRKTGTLYFSVILPMAVRVLEKWGWRVPPISNTNYNIYLDRIAILCGIHKHITSHIGRHTYACQCLSHGVRIEAVQRALGHTRISTTQIYARMVDMDVINAFDSADL